MIDQAAAGRRAGPASRRPGPGLAASPFRVDRDRIAALPVLRPAGRGHPGGEPDRRRADRAQPAHAQPAGGPGGPGHRGADLRRPGRRGHRGRARRLRPGRRRGRGAGPRPGAPAVRAPGGAGARPARPGAARAARRVRGQRAELPHRHHDRPARAGRHRAGPHRGRARGRAQVPVGPLRPPRPAPERRGAGAARRRPAARRPGRRLGQVLLLLHRARRPAGLPGGVRPGDRAVGADRGGGRDGHRRRHRLRHPRPGGLPPGRGAAAGRGGGRAGRLAAPAGRGRAVGRRTGADLERLRRRLAAKDGWVFDDDAFAAAVDRVRDELVDGLLAVAVRRVDGRRAGGRRVLRPLDGAAGRGGAGAARAADPGRARDAGRSSSGTRWRC